MYGFPETPVIDGTEDGKLVASISITREPRGCEPFIQLSYEVSLRVFGIALALAKMDGSLNKGIIESRQTQNSQNSNQNDNGKYEDYAITDVRQNNAAEHDTGSAGETEDNNDKSLAGRKKVKNKSGI